MWPAPSPDKGEGSGKGQITPSQSRLREPQQYQMSLVGYTVTCVIHEEEYLRWSDTHMTTVDERRKEANSPKMSYKTSITTPKSCVRIGMECKNHACHRKDSNNEKRNETLPTEHSRYQRGQVRNQNIHRGDHSLLHQRGVAIITDTEEKKSLMKWNPVYIRIISANLYCGCVKTTVHTWPNK